MHHHEHSFSLSLPQGPGKSIRRPDKEVTDPARIDLFLKTATLGFLGLADEEGTYVVPMNFVWMNGFLYFHGSEAGRKNEALRRGGTVCFTAAREDGIIANPIPAKTSTAYFSVMVFGTVREVTELSEATQVLEAMLDKYVPGYFSEPLSHTHVEKYRSSLGSKTVVYRLTPARITAKEGIASPMQLFYPGRKQQDDLSRQRRSEY
jgi:uncharacterized protein